MLLKIDNVSLKLPQLERPILSDIQYEIHPGDFIIVLGSNGSGKSSLLKLLDKRYSYTSGKIIFDNRLLTDFSLKKLHQSVTTLTQNYHESLFTSLTVWDNYLLFANNQQSSKIFFSDYIAQFNPHLPNKLDQLADHLSGGEKQALALGLRLLNPPKLLLLDEHTSALDPKTAQQLMILTKNMIVQKQLTCILTTHDLDIALHYGNRILALNQGSIIQMIDHEHKTVIDKTTLLAACY